MGRYQIVEKLDKFLSEGAVNNEAKAVYLLVEIRKILDHAYDKQKDFLLLRFYCDWIVHTEKSRNLEHIAPVVQKVYDDVRAQIQQSPHPPAGKQAIVGSIYMEALKSEMEGLFQKETLPLDLFQKERWSNFVAATVQILIDQPLLNPIPEVRRMVLTSSNPGCVCGRIEFAEPITAHDGKKHSHYDFANAY